MAFIQLCILFMLAICCEVHGGMKGLDGNVNCSSIAANNPVISIKSDRPVAAVAKCGGGYKKFTDNGNKSYSLYGYFTGSKSGCKWKRNSSVRHKIVYELMVRVKTMKLGKRHEMMKVVSCSFSYPGSSTPSPSANPFMPPKGMMSMLGKLFKADLVDLRMDTTHQTRQRQSYQARFRFRKKHKRHCGRAPYVANSYRSKHRARYHQRIVYRCLRGFVPYKGVTMVKCKYNGRYSKPTPRCVKRTKKFSSRPLTRSCGRGRTPYVRNSISGSGRPIKVNQKVRYSCKKGYRLYMGISSIKCRRNGRFTRKPICDKVYRRSCGRTPRVRYSRSGSRRRSRLNQVIRYRCRRGYKFYKNKSTIKCQSNGKFTKPPKCIRARGRRSCGRTPRVRNSVSGSRRRSRIGQVIRYRCRRGYKFHRGKSSIKCRRNGRFTRKPRCIRAARTCGKIPVVINSVSPRSRVQSKVNKVYRYKCKPGYRFYMGRSSIKCKSNGRFTPKPICDKVDRRSCGRTPRVRYSRSGSRRRSRLNQVIRYRCRRGYKFYKNKSTIKCQSNGKFTKAPKCIRARGRRSCGRTPRVRNSVSGSRRRSRIGQVIRYRCRRGYKFHRGKSSIKCRRNGRFTRKPRCIRRVRTCGKIPVVINSVSPRSRVQSKVNKVYRYKCKPGYRFYMGRSSIKCKSNGRFTPKPICDKVYRRSCGRTPRVRYSRSGSRRRSRLNQVIRYRCRRGYKFYKNKSTIKCQSNGKFTKPPKCIRARGRRSCGRTPRVRNSVSGSRRRSRIGQVIRYRCRRGYKFHRGKSSIKCRRNGRFTRKPRCIRRVSVRTCGKTPVVPNSLSTRSRVQSKVNKVYRYKCKPGYRFHMGRSSIKCRSNGRFTKKPRCIKGRSRSCGRTPRVRYSRSGSRRRSRLNQVIRYRCRRGYKFYKNKSTIKCQSNGKFTKAPKCIRVTTCGESPDVPNSISGSGRRSRIYQVIRYECESGYRFMWEISAIWCRPDGRFSFTPRCVKVDG